MSSFNIFCDPVAGQSLRVESTCCAGTISATANSSAILGGPLTNTHTNNADLSVILMGDTNTINTFGELNGSFNTIINGTNNVLAGDNLFIAGGCCNTICGASSFIGNGNENTIIGSSSFIGAGTCNTVNSGSSFIGSGIGNQIDSNASVIVGGGSNFIDNCGRYNFIGSGSANTIVSLGMGGTLYSVITGGSQNCIESDEHEMQFNTISGGSGNIISCNSNAGTIAGGSGNTIFAGAEANSITGGASNSICGSYSSILGGQGNTDAGFSYVGISGSSVTGVMDSAFHANTFVAQNMPDESALPLPSGALYFCSSTNVVYRVP